MNTIHPIVAFVQRLPGRILAGGSLAVVLLAGALPAGAQPFGPSAMPPHRDDLRVIIENSRSGPRFRAGPKGEEFYFVRGIPPGRLIDRRETLLDLLLHPAVNSLAWGLGELANAELAAALGLPVRTPLYAVQPRVVVVSAVPPGYFVAEALPQDVALVYAGPRGEPVVLVRRVPPGAVIAYQSSPTGVVLSECIVVPPVQMAVMPEPPPPLPAIYASQAAPAQPAPPPAPPVAMAAGKTSTVLYDANHNPIGVYVTDPDGKKEFVPIAP